MLGLVLSFPLGAWLSKEQDALADGLIRLHVVANSNSEADQKLKLDVRDRVLEVAERLYMEGLSPSEVEAVFLENLSLLAEAGAEVAEGYSVTAELTDVWFPSKEYDDFSLPAGEYRALKLSIGEAEGENWWCVAYPPLCLGAASISVEDAVQAGNFTQNEADFITGEGYVLKFKSIELWENLKHSFKFS